MIQLIKIEKSKRKYKKYAFTFNVDGCEKTVHFGSSIYDDYTQHKDEKRMLQFRNRHKHDHIDDPLSPGALSWFVLWSSPSFIIGLQNYMTRFNIE